MLTLLGEGEGLEDGDTADGDSADGDTAAGDGDAATGDGEVVGLMLALHSVG